MPSLSAGASLIEAGIRFVTSYDGEGVDQAKKDASSLGEQFSSSMKKVAVVTGVAGAALTAYSKSSVDYLQGVVKSSKTLATQTGMTIEQSSSLLAVMERMGVSSNNASTAFRAFSKQITDSANGTSDQALATKDLNDKIQAAKLSIVDITDEIKKHGDASGSLKNQIDLLNDQIATYQKKITETTNPLDKLNVATKNADGSTRSFNDILMDVADKFKSMPDGPEKTALAMQLFGRQGASMIKVLDKGKQGIQDLEDAAQKMGLTLTTKNVDQINKYVESQKQLADTNNSLRMQVGTLTAPVITSFNNTLNDMLSTLISTDSPFRQVTADVLAFGGPVLGAVSATASFLGNVGSALPLLGDFGRAMKMDAAFSAISSLVTVQFPSLIGAISLTEAAWTAAFPVAGILADIALVAAAVNAVRGAYDAVNDSQKAADNSETSYKASHAQLLDLKKNGTPQQKANAQKALLAGYASGTNSATAGWHLIGENGPEYMKFNGGEQVKDAHSSAKMAAPGGNTYAIQQVIVQAPNNATMSTILASLDHDNLLASKGFAPMRAS